MQNRQHKFFYPDQLENRANTGKIYYLPLNYRPEPSQPITGVPIKQRRRHKEDSITITLGWMCILLTVSVVVVQVGKWMGW